MSVLLDPKKDYKRFIATKNINLLPERAKEEIKLLQIGHEPSDVPNVYGSYRLKIQQYPGDIDLLENYARHRSKREVLIAFEKDFRKLVHNILAKKLHYYSEIKVGLDDRYDIDIGKLNNGVYLPNKNLIYKVNDLYYKKLLARKDYDILSSILSNNILNANDYDVVSFILREYKILRWSAEEILNGRKRVIGKTISLMEALQAESLVKIDEITFIQEKIYEITNIYLLSYFDEHSGKMIPLNPIVDISLTLSQDAEKLYYSNMWYNPFKALKRIYALCMLSTHNNDPPYMAILQKLFQFISSNTSLLYQIKSELDTIILLCKKIKVPPMASIRNQLIKIESNLSTIIDVSDAFYENLYSMFEKAIHINRREAYIKILKDISSIIKNQINYNTILYLNKIGLNPFPSFLLPPNHKYDRNIVRRPESIPADPLEKYEHFQSTKMYGEGYEIYGGCSVCGGCATCGNFKSDQNEI